MPDYAVDYESNIDLHNNQIKNVVIDSVTSDPAGVNGKIIYNTTEQVLKYYDGESWVTLAQGGDLSGYQLKAEKNLANGYAGLDAGGKIVIGQLPTGAGAQSIPLIVGTIGDGAVLQYSQTSGGFVARVLGNVYTYKGSVANSTALPSGAATGDVYNIEAAGGGYNAGDNVAWDGTKWDRLAGTIDTSGFQTKANIAQDLSSPSADKYPSTAAVSSALAGKQDTISLTADRVVVSGASGALEASAVTSTELGYLSGVDSAIQDQIDAKQDAISGAISTYLNTNATADRIIISNSSGKLATSEVSSALLANLTGLTGPIQTQIDAINTELDGKADAVTQAGGTYAKVTVNTQGVVTSGQAQIAVADISDLSTTLADYVPTSQKGVADGVATLGSDTKVPMAQLNTGVGNNTIPVLTGTASTGQVVTYNGTGLTFATPVKRDPVHTIQGNGSAASFEIEHTLGVPPLAYTIVNNSTHKVIQTEVLYGDGTDDTTGATVITVNFNTAPANNVSYSVYLVG